MKETMLAVVQEEAGGLLKIKEIPIPQLKKGEVLVKMHYASINPSDLSFLQGSYAEKPEYPIVPGIEGSGEVVASGGGFLANLRKGKIVACTKSAHNSGTWAEYLITSASNVVPLPKGIESKSGASMLVNPLTAVSFIHLAKRGNHKVVYNNAAGGALGKMLVRLCTKNHIEIINEVRSESQAKDLKNIGAKHIIDSSKPNYLEEMESVFSSLKPTLLFDAICGSKTNDLIRFAPANSTLMPYANLSEDLSIYDSRLLLQKNIKISGFFLSNYNKEVGILKVLKNISQVKKLIDNDLTTNYQKVVSFKNVNEAINEYRNNMSQGKILLNFQ
ncbi:MAG: zinc-binding dehydrogenase [Bacteroidales bacterium]|nr:zinc-binding dehydrogenase [Bacteroidales bacterium]